MEYFKLNLRDPKKRDSSRMLIFRHVMFLKNNLIVRKIHGKYVYNNLMLLDRRIQ